MNDKTQMSREEEMLKSIARQVHPSPSFTNELEKKLMNAHKPEKPGLFSVKKFAFTAGWAVALAALALTFISVIRSIAPQPQPATDGTPVPAIETATPQPQELPEGKTYKTSMQDFVMTVDFPEAVPQTTLYELEFPARDNPNYESESLRDLAARMGIDGVLYHLEDHNGGAGFLFTDGKQRLEVNDMAPYRYTYFADFTRGYYQFSQQNPMSVEEMTAKAEEFLEPRGLLDFPYQVAPSSPESRAVTFEPRLGDTTQTLENLTTLNVSFDHSGEIFSISLHIQPCKSVGVYPLISAEQAWNKFVDYEFNGLGAEMQSYGYSNSQSSFRRWERETPLNEPTYIISVVESFQPVEGDTPLLMAGTISLTGNLEGLTNNRDTLQLNGRYIMDGEVKKFQVDDWTASEPPSMLSGTLEQADGQTWLITTEGERLLLENTPTDLVFGEMTYVNGLMAGDKFDWITIDQGQGGGGGGGGGGAGLARVNLSGTPMPTATPWAVSTPVDYASLTGSRIEGERGDLYGWNLEAEDGATHFAYQISGGAEEGLLGKFGTANLEGPGTKGMEAYFHLPVRIWGTISSFSQQGIPTIQVDRYEAVYPDAKVQLWIGEEKVTQVEGKDVLLFTAEDGTSYVRKDSIDYLTEPTVAEPGLVYYIVGWVNPEETFGEYPVLGVMGLGTISRDSDFDAILADNVTPPIMPESSINLSGEIPTGVVTHIELVYQNEDQLVYEPEEGRVLYAQPFWRFSGYDGESSYFDIIVQALTDEYLQPVPLE